MPVAILKAETISSPIAERTVRTRSFSALNSFSMSSASLLESSLPAGSFRSSFVLPSSAISERKPSSDCWSRRYPPGASGRPSCCRRRPSARGSLRRQCRGGVLLAGNIGDLRVVRGGLHVLLLRTGEDVDRHKLALGVAVLAGLRGRDVDHLAGAALDDQVPALADRARLHRVRQARARVRGLELLHILDARHGELPP